MSHICFNTKRLKNNVHIYKLSKKPDGCYFGRWRHVFEAKGLYVMVEKFIWLLRCTCKDKVTVWIAYQRVTNYIPSLPQQYFLLGPQWQK